MINSPYNVPLMPQITTGQSLPMQTSHTAQTVPCSAYPGNPQDPFKQGPFYQFHQQDLLTTNHQYIPNALSSNHPIFQPSNLPPSTQAHQLICGPVPQNIPDQIRGCTNNAAPIFILPAGCHQSTNHQQQGPLLNQGGVPQSTGQSTGFSYPPSIYPPPSFYPYPIPLPVYEPFGALTRCKDRPQSYGCCQRRQDCGESKNHSPSCCCRIDLEEPHRCTATSDDTICSKRNCPASISLQALASQFLSVPGIISCAATRLLLRKVPGSNITSTMEDTMDRAQRSISVLTKDQLLAESRNAQQVNALINLHMTTNVPANIIPFLTLLQLKVNVLKAQIEALINKKVMECQGYGYEIETSAPIDPAALTLKTNAELRELLSALRQKECDERVNVNFSPYHSQRVIAESRLNNVQAKIRQVEAEFDRRRCVSIPTPTMTSRVIQQFAEARCTFDFAQTRLFEPYRPGSIPESPDPFVPCLSNPRRLYLKPRVPEPEARQKESTRGTNTSKDGSSTSKDAGTGAESKDKSVERRCSADSCSCNETSSEESLQDKKKLRLKIDRAGNVTLTSVARLRDVTLMKLTPNVSVDTDRIVEENRPKSQPDDDRSIVRDIDGISEISDSPDEYTTEKIKSDTLEDKEVKTEIETDDEFEDLDKLVKIKTEPDDFSMEDDEETWPMIKQEDIKTEPFDDVKLEIKEEDEDDTWKKLKFEPIDVKVEPISIESIHTLEGEEFQIKKEEPEEDEEDQLHPDTEKYVRFDPKTVKTEFYIEPKRKKESSEDVFVTHLKINVNPGQSQTVPKIKVTDIENLKTRNIEPVLGETETKKRSTIEKDVSKAHQTKTEVSAKEPSSGAFKGQAESLVKSKKTEKVRGQDVAHEIDSKKDGETGNVQIVSMVTDIKYDGQFDDYGRFIGTNDSNDQCRPRRISVDFSRNTEEQSVIEKYAQLEVLSKKMDPSMVSVDRRHETKPINNRTGETYQTEINTRSQEVIESKNFQLSREKFTDGVRHFPPLKYSTPNGQKRRISRNRSTLYQKGIESKAWNNTSIPYQTETENSIVSTIYSTIESHLATFSSLIGNIPNFQNILWSLYSKKLSRTNDDIASTNGEVIIDKELNKTLIAQNDDWILLPSDVPDERDHDSVDGGFSKVRKFRQSIIVDKENKNYVLIGGSVSGQLRELSRKGFARPYQTRRSLLIRSRLKDSDNYKHEYPFTVLKGVNKSHLNAELNTREKCWSLENTAHPKISNNTCDTQDNVINTSENAMTAESGNICGNNDCGVSAKQKSAGENEQTI